MKALLLAPMGSVHRRFNYVNIEALQKLGYEVHLAANFEKGDGTEQQNPEFVRKCTDLGIITHSLPYMRHEIKNNIKLVKPTRELILKEKYNLVHAHTETGGLILKLVGNVKAKKIFTPHGMSFYKGAPLKAQIIYKPIEYWICSGMDCNIAINQEEYHTLLKWNHRTAKMTHGIGLDVEKYRKREKTRSLVREELGIPQNAIVILSIGELDDNKNHRIVIDAIKDSGAYYLICGIGPNAEKLRSQAVANGIENRVILAGYRNDIPDVIGASDIFAFPSYHEGLPVSLLEAMAGGLPAAASNIRGNVDLIENGRNGFLSSPNNVNRWKKILDQLMVNEQLCDRFSNKSNTLVNQYCKNHVLKELLKIYDLNS